ncbi:uncharacterized protein [Venturia canescens]|uniref:uncharacterized protein n=1 Tax=Venturia canescens TaxID=32260 RepID=UPI001C9CFCE1|nr:uncharacterized protein LOC122409849 [Venturia canescens]XP_043273666.1 uncharacterized protein LOC122409849 [Venturia canescens]
MKTSIPGKLVGCIGKCTSGLTAEELDHVTDNIHKTLTHPRGRKIFKEYLKQERRHDDLECLKFYEKCSEFIEKEQNYSNSEKNPTLDSLIEDVNDAMLTAENLDGIPEIDMSLLEKYNEILTRPPCRQSMLSLLEETKIRLMNHLRRVHRGFRDYALQPCPRTK